MFALLIFLLVLGILILVHEFGHFMAARKVGVKVEKFSLGFGKSLLKKKSGDTEYSINAIPLGGYVKLAGDSREESKGEAYEYLSKSPGERAAIIFFGPLLNYVLAFLCFWFIFFIGYPTLTTKVGGLVEDFGAQKAGIEVGDKVIAIDGINVGYWEDMQRIVSAKKDASVVRLTVLRAGEKRDFEVKIREKKFQDMIGSTQSVGLIGVKPSEEIVTIRHGIIEAFGLGFSKTIDLTVMTYKALWRMTVGKLSFRESVTGPLGIFYITSKAANIGFIAIIHLIAVLSVSLCIFNLLPFPVLDGGHLFLLAVEKIRKKPLSVKAEHIINQIGFSLIIALAVFVTINDLMKFKDNIIKFFVK